MASEAVLGQSREWHCYGPGIHPWLCCCLLWEALWMAQPGAGYTHILAGVSSRLTQVCSWCRTLRKEPQAFARNAHHHSLLH